MNPTEIRLALLDHGYKPVFLNGKNPNVMGKGWPERCRQITREQIIQWARQPGPLSIVKNTGVLACNTPCLDIDIKYEPAAIACEELVRERLDDGSPVLVRIGNPPKRAIPFQANIPFKKIKAELIAPDGSDGQGIEFLGDGQQFAAFGFHPDTGQPYRWPRGSILKWPRTALPAINEDQARELVKDLADLLTRDFSYRCKTEQKPLRSGLDAKDLSNADAIAKWRGHLTGFADHDSTCSLIMKLLAAGMNPGAAHNLVRAGIEQAETSDAARRARRIKELPGMIEGAIGKAREQRRLAALIPESDLNEMLVILAKGGARHELLVQIAGLLP